MFGIKTGEKETRTSVTGKDLRLDNERDILYLRDLDEYESYNGNPIVSIFTNEEKSYNSVSIRLVNDNEELRLNVNYPKKDCPIVKNLNTDFGFYLNAFNLVKDTAILVGVDGVDNNTNMFKEVDFKELLEYIDGLDNMEVMAYYPKDSEYMTFRTVKVL